jgi:hypothetical protein
MNAMYATGTSISIVYALGSFVDTQFWLASLLPATQAVSIWYDIWRRRRQVIARLSDADKRELLITRVHMTQSRIVPDREHSWALELAFKRKRVGLREKYRALDEEGDNITVLKGEPARLALSRVLPGNNSDHGSRKHVDGAVKLLASTPGFEVQLPGVVQMAMSHHIRNDSHIGTLSGLAPELRLALEMAVHEDDERRAFEGELDALRKAWEDADALASIADNMFLPQSVASAYERLKGNRNATAPDAHEQ